MGAPAAGLGVRLALDHHYSPLIAVGLRARGQDALAAVERGVVSSETRTSLPAAHRRVGPW